MAQTKLLLLSSYYSLYIGTTIILLLQFSVSESLQRGSKHFLTVDKRDRTKEWFIGKRNMLPLSSSPDWKDELRVWLKVNENHQHKSKLRQQIPPPPIMMRQIMR
ncbi:uncharacterized protein LOC134856975 isoform X1 [Symsagittifera roscoffensis]|uniref:uncharacterized protein LOC134856975 isoform X1 n=1 Tax=Symsagittifera roscoffensis TaxID=84072 RepID=UPI00307BABBD